MDANKGKVPYHGAQEVQAAVRKIIYETEVGANLPMSTNIMVQRLIRDGMMEAMAAKLPSQIRKGAPLFVEWKTAFLTGRFVQKLGRTSTTHYLNPPSLSQSSTNTNAPVQRRVPHLAPHHPGLMEDAWSSRLQPNLQPLERGGTYPPMPLPSLHGGPAYMPYESHHAQRMSMAEYAAGMPHGEMGGRGGDSGAGGGGGGGGGGERTGHELEDYEGLAASSHDIYMMNKRKYTTLDWNRPVQPFDWTRSPEQYMQHVQRMQLQQHQIYEQLQQQHRENQLQQLHLQHQQQHAISQEPPAVYDAQGRESHLTVSYPSDSSSDAYQQPKMPPPPVPPNTSEEEDDSATGASGNMSNDSEDDDVNDENDGDDESGEDNEEESTRDPNTFFNRNFRSQQESNSSDYYIGDNFDSYEDDNGGNERGNYNSKSYYHNPYHGPSVSTPEFQRSDSADTVGASDDESSSEEGPSPYPSSHHRRNRQPRPSHQKVYPVLCSEKTVESFSSSSAMLMTAGQEKQQEHNRKSGLNQLELESIGGLLALSSMDSK